MNPHFEHSCQWFVLSYFVTYSCSHVSSVDFVSPHSHFPFLSYVCSFTLSSFIAPHFEHSSQWFVLLCFVTYSCSHVDFVAPHSHFPFSLYECSTMLSAFTNPHFEHSCQWFVSSYFVTYSCSHVSVVSAFVALLVQIPTIILPIIRITTAANIIFFL